MNWLNSVILGFVSGLSEPMPLSAEANMGLLRYLFDITALEPLFLLACHGAVLIVVLSAGRLELRRLWRTAKILRTPVRRRTGRPSLNQAGTLCLLRSAALLTILGRVLSLRLGSIADRLWLLALPLLLGGLLLWLSAQMPTANKDGRHLTAADGLLLGAAALAAAVPGLSLVGTVLAVASMRGTGRQYAVRFAWLLLALSLTTAVALDLLRLVRTGISVSADQLLYAGLGGAAAAAGAWLGIHALRSRTRANAEGAAGFCFYNWGTALLCLALFLLI